MLPMKRVIVSDFNQINTNGDMEIIVSPGNNNSVVVQGDSNVLPNIQTSVNNNVLTVSNSNVIGGSKPAKIYITVVDLNAVQVGGSGNFTGTDLKLKSLNLFLSGSGSINLVNLVADSIKLVNSGLTSLSGNVKSQEIIISGTGEYKAKDLQSNTATVEIDGSGQATLNVINQLNIIINGSGQVSYLGNPNIQQQVIGSGTVKKVG
jgi:hypothetical protein